MMPAALITPEAASIGLERIAEMHAFFGQLEAQTDGLATL